MASSLNVVDLARTLIGLDTVNPPGNETACSVCIGNILDSAGYDVSFHEPLAGRKGLVARIGRQEDEKGAICLAGHLDTVPLGAASWSHDPFGGEIVDGKLYGRGSSDMKGGIAAMVAAAVELAAEARTSPGIELVFVIDEETGCNGSSWLAEHPEHLGSVGALILGEPTQNAPMSGHKGAFWINAVAEGRTAHGAMPHLGINAIIKAARALLKLTAFDFNIAPHPVLGSPTLNIGTFRGGMNINSVPDRAEFSIDIRTIPGLEHQHLEQRLLAAIGDDVALTTKVSVEGLWTDPKDDWVQDVFSRLERIQGSRPEVSSISYFTDAGMLTPAYGNVPTLILGPGQADQAHQTDEYCRVDRLHEAVAIYKDICSGWCGIQI